jgi:acyl-CoA synthetase (AMP-forming)/AMP-acid ligase II
VSSRPETIGAVVDARAADSGARPFVTTGGATISYGEFADLTWRLTGALAELGVGHGDKVCLFLPNGLPFALGLFAAARLGAPFVPAHAQFTARELRHVLQHADAVAVLTDAERLPVVQEVRADCPLLRTVVVADGPAGAGTLALGDLLRAPARPEAGGRVEPGDAAGILYTSGTTGQPKGAVLTHRGYMLNASAFAERTAMSADEVLYCVLPLAHLNAQRSSLLPAALTRARLALAERFSASAFWPDVRAHGATFFSVMPTVVAILLQQPPGPGERDHRVRLCVTPITAPLQQAFESRFGIPVVNTYGLTEGMLNVMNFADGRRRPGIGTPLLPDVHRLRIVDDEDRDVPRGSVGEIVLQSPAVMAGYYKDPAATARALRGGWLHTGDLGYLDGEEFLHFVGRRKEMIRRGGENIAPAEIEAVLASHPGVQEAVVVGVPDPLREEEVKACVILKPGEDEESVPPAALLAHCAGRLAAFKVPRYLEYRRDFPRTPTLRVKRHELTAVTGADGARVHDAKSSAISTGVPAAPAARAGGGRATSVGGEGG